MVAPTDLFTSALRAQAFKGFVQFQEPDGSTWYRLKERQTMNLNLRYNRVEHYTDDGKKFVDPAGTSHGFTMNIKMTSDMFDDQVWTDDNENSGSGDGYVDDDITGWEKQSLSYWIYKNEINDPIEIVFVTSFPTKIGPAGDTGDDKINLKFVLDPNTFTPTLGASGGVPEISISGIVLRVTDAIRSSTTEQ